LSKVEEVSGKVTERWWKSKTLSDVAKTHIELGNIDRADQLVSQIEFDDHVKEVRSKLDKVKKGRLGLKGDDQTPRGKLQ